MSEGSGPGMAAAVAELFDRGVSVSVCGEGDKPAELYPDELRAVERAVPKRKREFALGRTCAREALRRLGIDDCPIPVAGDRSPVWPKGITGSITHCHGFVAAAVGLATAYEGIGLDAEPALPLDEELIEKVCVAEERELVAGRSSGFDGDLAKLIFCAKESVYKCFYPTVKSWIGFEDVVIDLEPDRGIYRVGRLLVPQFDDWFRQTGRHACGRFIYAGGLVIASTTMRRGPGASTSSAPA